VFQSTATSVQCSTKTQTNILTNKKLQRVNTTMHLTNKKKRCSQQRKQQPTFLQIKNCCAVRFQKGVVNDAVNVRSIKPFHKQKAVPNCQQALNQPFPDHGGKCRRPMSQQTKLALPPAFAFFWMWTAWIVKSQLQSPSSQHNLTSSTPAQSCASCLHAKKLTRATTRPCQRC
jgi:hypothetical protein